MMKIGGIHAEKEAINFIMDKVGEPHISAYINHAAVHNPARKSKYAITPGLHAHNFQQASKQSMILVAHQQQRHCFRSKNTRHAKSVMITTTTMPTSRSTAEPGRPLQSTRANAIRLTRSLQYVVEEGSSDIGGPFKAARQAHFYRTSHPSLHRIVQRNK